MHCVSYHTGLIIRHMFATALLFRGNLRELPYIP